MRWWVSSEVMMASGSALPPARACTAQSGVVGREGSKLHQSIKLLRTPAAMLAGGCALPLPRPAQCMQRGPRTAKGPTGWCTSRADGTELRAEHLGGSLVGVLPPGCMPGGVPLTPSARMLSM